MTGVVVMLSIFVSLLQRYYNLKFCHSWLEEVKTRGIYLPKLIKRQCVPTIEIEMMADR